MQAIVVGCGKVGSLLARLLVEHGDDVAAVDEDASAFERLGSGFNGETIHGKGVDVDVLRAAGAETSDALVAVTSNDNVNLVAAQVAKEIFHVPVVLCRVHDERREQIYRSRGMETISPTRLTAQQMMRRLVAGTTLVQGLPTGYVWKDVTVGPSLADRTVEEAEKALGARVLFAYRGGEIHLATSGLRIALRDVLATVLPTAAAARPGR